MALAAIAALGPFYVFCHHHRLGFGMDLFGEFPVNNLFPGALLIILAGGVIIWREHYVKKTRKYKMQKSQKSEKPTLCLNAQTRSSNCPEDKRHGSDQKQEATLPN